MVTSFTSRSFLSLSNFRTRVTEIRVVGRNTIGVKLMNLRNGEKLQAIAPVVSEVEEEAQAVETSADQK